MDKQNYRLDGEWVIGGKLTVLPGAEVTGLPGGEKIDFIPDSNATTAAGIKADFNRLLAAMREAGVMKNDPNA